MKDKINNIVTLQKVYLSEKQKIIKFTKFKNILSIN